MTRNKLTAKFALIGLLLITLSIYFPPFAWAFVGDDYVQFDYIKEVIARPWLSLSLFNPYTLPWYYRPLQLIWFWLLEAIFHFTPDGYYWVELLFHALAVALVYRVARQLKLSQFTAVLAATLFAIHSHWVDVVSWLSSIAIVLAAVFSLLTVSAWLSYLKRPSTRQLLLTLLFCLLTFLSHEESVLLPPFLLLMLLAERVAIGDWRLRRSRLGSNRQPLIFPKELLLFATLGLITTAYLYFQFTRPNLTIDLTSRGTAEWLTFLSWPAVAEFIIVTLFRFTFVGNLLELGGTAASLLAMITLLLLGLWFWWGSRTVRLGLVWLGLHLMFIYWALWSQLPELYAGRHIYQAMIGLVLAIGASLDTVVVEKFLTQRAQREPRKKEETLRSLRPLRFNQIVLAVIVTAVALYHASHTRKIQQDWLNNVTEEAVARQQLKAMFPTISPDDHFFAVRFPIAPQFTRSVVQLWYDTPLERPGGGLDHLRAVNEADRTFVVLDYANGQVYNLMPELQQHDQTIFLWAKPLVQFWLEADGQETAVPQPETTLPVVEAQNGRQLAVKMTPENGRWLVYSTTVVVPENSMLQTAVLPQPGLRYRLRLIPLSGDVVTLFDSATGEANNWQPVELPLEMYGETAVTLRFEVMGENATADVVGYWGNPRLAVDSSSR